MKRITLTAAQVQMASKMGISPADYAKQLAKASAAEDQEYDPNNDPIYTAPIESVKNMWIARYGDRWVERFHSWDDGDESWRRIANRLDSYGLLEEDHEGGWVKIKEDLK